MIPRDFVDDLRARVPVSQIVGRKVRLKKAGREWKGLSPFTSEKTPSLCVNDQKARWFDFSSGKDGDIFSWLMETEGLSYPEAVEKIAGEAGLEVPKANHEAVKREARKLGLLDVMDRAQEFFTGHMTAEARDYLKRRGIDNAAAGRLGIGWAPAEGSALKVALAEIDAESLVAGGLVVAGADIPVSRDRFKGRITIPIRRRDGRIVGFGARGLANEKPKYLNSPETEIFHKGEILFNADQARQPAHDGQQLIAVEGYFDAITAVINGFPATVATMGTAITEAHVLGLWQMHEAPVMCFDGDAAGRRAADKAAKVALPLLKPGRTMRFAFLPAGKDPDLLIREGGAEALGKAVAAAVKLSDLLWLSATQGRSLTSPEALSGAEAALMEQISTIADAQIRAKFAADAKARIGDVPKRPMIVRSNGSSNHSASPGAIRLRRGLDEPAGFSLKEAALVAELAKAPDHADPERLAKAGISERTRQVIAEIINLIGTVPEDELQAALNHGKIGSALEEARSVLRAAGIKSLS